MLPDLSENLLETLALLGLCLLRLSENFLELCVLFSAAAQLKNRGRCHISAFNHYCDVLLST
jgi:hypothetical protein